MYICILNADVFIIIFVYHHSFWCLHFYIYTNAVTVMERQHELVVTWGMLLVVKVSDMHHTTVNIFLMVYTKPKRNNVETFSISFNHLFIIFFYSSNNCFFFLSLFKIISYILWKLYIKVFQKKSNVSFLSETGLKISFRLKNELKFEEFNKNFFVISKFYNS